MKQEKTPFNFKAVLKKAAWLVAVAGFFIVFSFSVASSNSRQCSEVYIKIDHDSGLFFVDENDVLKAIEGYYDSDLRGLEFNQINFTDIEEKIEANPYVAKAEIFTGAKGAVHLDVRQRQPLVRVFNNSGVSYYLDANGTKIPASSKFTARVVVATGEVENSENPDAEAELLKLCRFISGDDFWKAQFEQIHITREGEFELVPKLANHIIRFGRTDGMEDKFKRLMIFYEEVLKNFDANGFRIVNLKYKDQIICTKNIN